MKRILTYIVMSIVIAMPCMAEANSFIEQLSSDPNVTVTYISQAMLESKRYKDMMNRLPIASKDARFDAVQIYNCQSHASSSLARDYVAAYVKEKTAESEKSNAEYGKVVQEKPQLLMKSSTGKISTLIYGFYGFKDKQYFDRIIILMAENNTTTLIDIKGWIPIYSLIIGN